MSDKPTPAAPKLEIVPPTPEELDAEEQEFRALRRDLPGVKGASAVGIVSIGVAKIPGRNEFFRTHKEFRPVVPIVDVEVGMDRHYIAVSDEMVEALAGIGITVTNHTLYLTVTSRGAVRIIPVRCTAPTASRMNTPARKRSVYCGALTNGCGCTPTRITASTKSFPRQRTAFRMRSGQR